MISAPRSPLLEDVVDRSRHGDLRAVWDVSFSVWRGKVTALLGPTARQDDEPSGDCGSAELRSGDSEFRGTPGDHLPPHRRVELGMALVQENKRVFRRRTVEQNLLLGGYRLSRGDRKTALETAYQSFPILYAKRRTVAAGLSGGQQQMLAIAQALMRKPILVMLDEPSRAWRPLSSVMSSDRCGRLLTRASGSSWSSKSWRKQRKLPITSSSWNKDGLWAGETAAVLGIVHGP